MSEDERSSTAKSIRILIVANPGDSDGSSDEDDRKSFQAESSSRSQGYTYQPPPLPSTNRSPQGARPIPPHQPSPLKTNLPLDKGHHSQSSRSNPTLSSPSSTSSPAVDTTPPPSTPGFSAPALDLPVDVSVRQEPLIGPSCSDGHIATRAANIFDKIKTHLTHHRSSPQRTSGNSFHLSTSPTASTPDSYASPTNTRSEKLLLMVTTDGDQYLTVEITGPKSAAIIRERIFTRLHVSDEDQAHYSIYKTKLGGFAIGDALTDEQILNLCRERGDDPLWFFVSHSSAPVHEMSRSSSSISPTTVSTIPPPVLPLQNGAYGLLRPRSRSKHGSVSSASERLPPEVGAGYDASVSDDLDVGERESNRSTMRAPPSRSTATTHKNYPSSPDRGRRPSIPQARPMSPLSMMRPSSPLLNTRDPGLEAPSTRSDTCGTVTPTPPPAPVPPSLSPNSAGFLNSSPVQNRHARSGSDAAAEHEQTLQLSEDQVEQTTRQWQHRQKDDRSKLDRARDRYGSPVKTRGQRSKRSADVDESSDKVAQNDSWVVVGNETPRAASKSGSSTSQDGQRISPSILKDRTRGPNYLPYTQYGGRLSKTPRNPPLPPPVGANESRPSSSRTTAQAPLPSNWAVTWKVPDKTDQKTPPVSTPQWSRLAAKSMTDLRNATYNNGIPPNLQSGPRQGNNLPMTRPERREGVSIPTTAYTDGPSSGRDLTGSNVPGLPKSYDAQRPLRPLPKQGSSLQSPSLTSSQSPPKSYGSWVPPLQPPPNNYSTLVSPSGDPMPRPQSALSTPFAPPPPQRYQGRNYINDQDDIDTMSPHSSSPLRQAGMTGRLGIGREEGLSQSNSRHGLRLNPSSGSYPPMHSPETHSGSETPRTPPRTPVSPQSPRHSAQSSLAESSNRLGSFIPISDTNLSNAVEESVNSNETIHQDDHAWIREMLDGGSAGSATIIPKSVDIGQSPMPTQPGPPTQPLPPLPSQLQADSFPAISYNPSQSTLVAEEDSESDDDDLWQTKPTPRSPRIKSISRDKSFARGPQLTVQTEKISNLPPSSFRNKGSEHASALSRPAADASLSIRKLASLTPNSGKIRQRGSTFTDNERTWAPRPAPEEVYERLEEFFPEHDLDKPVIEASSGSGSPTTAENPAVPSPADKDRPDKALVKAKKSIRIVAEEHKKRIDRTSRAENFASVLRKRSTKLWGSRLEEVTTEQAKAEQARALYAKSTPESPSGGPRPIFKWVRGELIGKGTYGRVYLALNATTGEMIAVKQVEIPQTASDKNDSRQAVFVKALKSESETLKDLDHPNVVQYLGFEETPNFLSIFLEYVPGGSIGSCLMKYGKFDEEVTKSFTEQILTGLEYLHSQGILHRDLKADNILVETTGICKISDFGISKRTDDINGIGASTAMQGTVFWMAPEVIDTPKKGYDKKIDIWSVGCVVLEMWAGKRPWSGNEAIAVILKLHKSKLPPPVPDDIVLSLLAQNFYNQCFAINPEERPTAALLRKHPYLTLPPDWVFGSFKSEH